jgi:protein O-mannosyl-transferase
MRLRTSWRWVALVIVALAPYLHTLGYGFVDFDDWATIVDLQLIRKLTWETLPSFFKPDIYAALYEYMPLKNLSYAVDYALLGPSGPAFRPQQYFWYASSVLALFAWLRRLLGRLAELDRLRLTPSSAEWVAFGVSVLFALHPAHVESVVWLSGRKDVLAGAFLLAALGFGLAFTLRLDSEAKAKLSLSIASLICLALALLSKPTSVATAPLLLAQDFWVAPAGAPRRRWLQVFGSLHLPAWLLTGSFAVFYSRVVGQLADWSDQADLALAPPAPVRIGEQLVLNLGLILDPSRLAPSIPPTVLDPRLTSPLACAGYVALVGLALVVVWGWRRRHPLALGVLLFVLPILPSLLKPSWGQYVAGRYLYHALIGPALVLVWLAAYTLQQRERLRPLVLAAVCALALVWTGGSVTYATAFRDSVALWAYAADAYPKHAQFYAFQVRALFERGDAERAVPVLEKCLRENPKAWECASQLGGLLLTFDPPRGEKLLLQILPYDLGGNAHLRLAQYWSQHGKTREAVNLYEGWLVRSKVSVPVMLGALVDLALADGQVDKARKYLLKRIESASALQPASPPETDVVVNAAERAGDHALAERARSAAERCNRSDCFAAALTRGGRTP